MGKIDLGSSYEEVQESLKDVNPDDLSFEDIEKEPDEGEYDLTEPPSEKKEEKEPEEEVEVEEEVEEEEKGTGKKAVPTKKAEDEKLKQAILSMVGNDIVLTAKGKQRKLSDLTPEEVTNYFNKGWGFYQEMESLATVRKALDREKQAVAQQAREVRDYVSTYGGGQFGDKTRKTPLPPELQPSATDEPEVAGLKAIASQLWTKVQDLSVGAERQQDYAKQEQVLAEIRHHQNEFPLASMEEIIAVKLLDPSADVRNSAMISHNSFGNVEFVQKIFKACPQVRLQIEAEAVKNYLARLKKKQVGSKPAGTGIVDTKKPKQKKLTLDYGFEDAKQEALKRLKDIERAMSEES